MGKHKKRLKEALKAKITSPDSVPFVNYREAVRPVPVQERCIFSGDGSWAVRCSHRAEFMLTVEAEDLEEQYCANHLGLALTELIEPGCGIDALTILRYPFLRITA